MPNPFENQVRSGKTVLVSLYLGDDSETPPSTEGAFVSLAATRGFSREAEWDTRDTTSRDSGVYRSTAGTFISGSGSIDGLTVTNNAFQRQVQTYILNPSAHANNTQGDPLAWLRVSEPAPGTGLNDGELVDLVTDIPVFLSSFNRDDPYDDNSTWTINYSVIGTPIETEIAD